MPIPNLFGGQGTLPNTPSATDPAADFDFTTLAGDESDDGGDDVESGTPAAEDTKPAKEVASEGQQEDAPAEEVESQVEAPALPEGFDEGLLGAAKQYGFSQEDAVAFGSPQNLQRAMAKLDLKMAEWGQQQLAAPAQQNTNAPAADAGKGGEANPATGFEKFKLDLDPKEFDEQTISLLNKQNDHYQSQFERQQQAALALQQEIAQLKQFAGNIVQQQQAEQMARLDSDIDKLFAGLSDEFQDTFGKEPLKALKPDSKEAQERFKVVQTMFGLQKAAEHTGQQLTLEQLHERAVKALHADKLAGAVRKQITEKVGERRKNSVARSTRTVDKPKSGEDAAKAFIKNFYKERGVADEERPAPVFS